MVCDSFCLGLRRCNFNAIKLRIILNRDTLANIFELFGHDITRLANTHSGIISDGRTHLPDDETDCVIFSRCSEILIRSVILFSSLTQIS